MVFYRLLSHGNDVVDSLGDVVFRLQLNPIFQVPKHVLVALYDSVFFADLEYEPLLFAGQYTQQAGGFTFQLILGGSAF